MTAEDTGASVAQTVIDVRTPELDSFGHVNHAVFLTYLEHGRFEAMQQSGFSWDDLDERGWTIFVVRLEIARRTTPEQIAQLLRLSTSDSLTHIPMEWAPPPLLPLFTTQPEEQQILP